MLLLGSQCHALQGLQESLPQSLQAVLVIQVIEVWVTILQAVPSARFLLKNKPFACAAAREHVLQLFVKKGIAAHRVDLLPLAPANAGDTCFT